MIYEQCTQLTKDLVDINEWRKEVSQCVLDITKKIADNFVDEDAIFVAQWAANKIGYGDAALYESSVDPPSDASIDESLFGMKSDYGSIVSSSSIISMEDVTKPTSLIDLTHADKNDSEKC